MKLFSYREKIKSRQATLETHFHIVIDMHVMYQKIKCYKGKELLIEDDEDVEFIRLVKARPSHLFKHELEVLKHKTDLTTLEGYAMKRFYRMWKCCSGLESKEKPHANAYHHEVV